MSTSSGENLAATLDKGINLVSILPEDHITAIGAGYRIGVNVLYLEQSPYLAVDLDKPHEARLRILGAAGGMQTYGDEDELQTSIIANDARLPDGTLVHILEPRSGRSKRNNFQLTPEVLETSFVISNFLRSIRGDWYLAELQFDADSETAINAEVQGVFTSDTARTVYLGSLASETVVDKISIPVSAAGESQLIHTVLIPSRQQLVTLTMHDSRPEMIQEMLRLRRFRDQT